VQKNTHSRFKQFLSGADQVAWLAGSLQRSSNRLDWNPKYFLKFSITLEVSKNLVTPVSKVVEASLPTFCGIPST
jgi:hypothetical protein